MSPSLIRLTWKDLVSTTLATFAIDYDPDWLRGEHVPIRHHLWAYPGTIGFATRATTDELSLAENPWFLDYRI